MKAVGYWLLVVLVSAITWAPAAHASWSYDPEVNNLVCAELGDQSTVQVVSDGGGGNIAVWVDTRAGNSDIYAQRVDAVGVVTWTAGGVAVCTAAGDQIGPRVVSDGAGGAVIVWVDARNASTDIYAQRIDAGGTVQWGTDGVAVCAEDANQDGAVLASDGSGGAYVAWEDHTLDDDVYAQLMDSGGTAQWTAGGIALSDTTGAQSSVAVTADPGGAIFVWSDDRVPGGGIHAARTDASGAVLWSSPTSLITGGAMSWDNPVIMADGWGGAFIACEGTVGFDELNILGQRVSIAGVPLWGLEETSICDEAGDQYGVRLVTDDAGGAILAWSDERSGTHADVYALRVDGWGASQWPVYPSGLVVSNGTDAAGPPDLTADGAGGAVITWHGGHLGYEDVYAQRVDSTGAITWAFGGEVVSSAFGSKLEPRVVSDGSGGGVIFWSDFRNSVTFDVYAQRMERNGFLGYPSSEITTVRDHPDDQGGEMVVSWIPSYLDMWPSDDVGYYTVWRRYSGTTRGPRPTTSFPWYLDPRDPATLERDGWEQVAAVQAHQLPEYSYVVPTYGDSTAAAVIWTDVMVLAHSYSPDDAWISETAMGYSIDNWAPGIPDSLKALAVGPDVELTWSPSGYHDDDLSHYDIHRSSDSGFTPDAATLVSSSADTVFVDEDPGSGIWFYRVLGEDVHGNEGEPSNEVSVPLGTGIDDGLVPEFFAIRGNSPNPFNPETVIAYDLPETAEVRLAVYSVDGRCVAVLEEGSVPAGRRSMSWRGLDAAGNELPSGVYFALLQAGEKTAIHKMVLLK